MSAPLLILTSSFPYGRGEPFFEPELAILARRFPAVILLPTSKPPGPARPVPATVEVSDVLCAGVPSKFQRALSGPLCAAVSPDFWRESREKTRFLTDPRGLSFCFNYLEQATRFAEKLDGFLQSRRLVERVVCYSYWATPAAIACSFVKRRHSNLRIVARFHGGDLYEERYQPAYIPLRRPLVDSLDRFLFISAGGLDYFAKRYTLPAERAEVRRLGVEAPAALAPLPASGGPPRILSCSWILPVKRLERLVDGLAALAQAVPGVPVEWSHIGDGPQAAVLQELARSRLPASVRCRFLGHLPNASVRQYYAENPVHALVNVSESEGLPVSFMEAMSFGVPVIAPDVGGIREIVRPESGVLLPSRPTPGDTAQALRRFLVDPDLRAKLGQGARAVWQQDFSAERNFNDLADLLDSI